VGPSCVAPAHLPRPSVSGGQWMRTGHALSAAAVVLADGNRMRVGEGEGEKVAGSKQPEVRPSSWRRVQAKLTNG
jgi:hypothetical protein